MPPPLDSFPSPATRTTPSAATTALTETFTKTLGSHTISAGADLFHRHHTERSAFIQSPVIGFNGQYDNGVPFADFLLGNAASWPRARAKPAPRRNGCSASMARISTS